MYRAPKPHLDCSWINGIATARLPKHSTSKISPMVSAQLMHAEPARFEGLADPVNVGLLKRVPIFTGAGFYTFRTSQGLCLAADLSRSPGRLVQTTCNGAASQQFGLNAQSDGCVQAALVSLCGRD
jgi:hypothetical protein